MNNKMRDSLKEHIDHNRDDFEVFDFDQELSLKQIMAEVGAARQVPFWRSYWKYAVAVCLVLVTGVASFYYGKTGAGQPRPEWVEAANYYQEQIEMKLSLVKSRVDDPELVADLESMDMAFSDLKNDLQDNVDNAEVVQAMMENYRLKLGILERILEELVEEENENKTEILL